MHPAEASAEPVRSQLEKILASPEFLRNERLSKFLRFIVEQQLTGKAVELKESLVGIEVFGRTPGFDPRQDSVVRTEAAKLRTRLSTYYAGEGARDPVVIELPKGGYAPVFRQPEAAAEWTPPVRGSAQPWLRPRAWLRITLACLGLVMAVGGWRWVTQERALIPIAVLPLNNLSQDSAKDYLADGLTYEIIRSLSIIEGLAVRSQTSSFSFKGRPRNIHEAGKQLNAEYILEGSVMPYGHQLRIHTQLVRVRDDFTMWSGKFDRELTDVFAIQDEISSGVVNSLRLKLGHGRRRYETSAEAYDLYLRACALVNQRGLDGYNLSLGLYQEAIAKDPSFAPAYAGLAAAHAARSGQFAFNLDHELSKMRAAADKAIQLDPLLAEAHDTMGMAYSCAAQWELSEKSFRRAIELNPGRSTSYASAAMYLLLPLGRIDEALVNLRRAEEADPLSPQVQGYLGYVLTSAGRYDEAARHCDKLPEDYGLKTYCVGRAWLGKGKIGEVVRMLEPAFQGDVPNGAPIRGVLGCAYARAGRREEAEQMAAVSSFNPLNQAPIYGCLGDKDRAFEALDRAAAAGPFRIGRALTWPELALLRGDPRVKTLRKKVGLPE